MKRFSGLLLFGLFTASVLTGAGSGCDDGSDRKCFTKRKLKRYCKKMCRKEWRKLFKDVEFSRSPKDGKRSGPVDPFSTPQIRRLIEDLKKSAWSSSIVFLDPKFGNDVWMRISVKPSASACVSNDATEGITTVPVPPNARLTACGSSTGGNRWYEHSRGVGVVEIHREKVRKKPHFSISWRNLSGNVRVFSQTFVLPEEYEWVARDMSKVEDSSKQTVPIKWKLWRHNILSMTVHDVHRIKGRLKYELRKTPLEEELLNAYKDCPQCIMRTEDGVTVRLPMKVLFASGSAVLAPKGQALLLKFIPVLMRHVAKGRRITVVGHTDTEPISTKTFPSNWELSASRASSVIRFFLSKKMPPVNFKAVGYAGTRPMASNDTAANRQKNRRVELFFETKGNVRLEKPAGVEASRADSKPKGKKPKTRH